MKKKYAPIIDNNWTRSDSYELPNGKSIVKDDVIRINGEQGQRFMFLEHVVNNDTGAEWITVNVIYKGTVGMFRSFRPDRIRYLPNKKKPKVRPNSVGNAKEIREWAEKNGLEVPSRGRIPSEVREKFNNSQGK